MESFKFGKANTRILEDNFVKALKDPDFVKVANSLNVSDDIKCRYTSTLQEISKELPICKKCKGLMFCPYDIKGVRKEAIVEDGIIKFVYRSCPYKEKNDKEKAYLKNIVTYKMPKEISEASFKNIYKDDSNRLEAIKYLKNFYDNFLKEASLISLGILYVTTFFK